MRATRSRLAIKNTAGKEVPAALAAIRMGTITTIIKVFRNMVVTSFRVSTACSICCRCNTALDNDSQGFEIGFSGNPNDYRFVGDGARSPASPPMAADPSATMISGVE